MTADYSVIVPAYNEEAWLARSLPALKAAMDRVETPGKLIVVDNNSADRTAQVAREQGAAVVFEPVNQISRARNAGARVAEGRYLIFVDADTVVPPELLEAALRNLNGGGCVGGGARIDFCEPCPPSARRFLAVWDWISVRFRLAAGSFVYCRRDAFEEVGGFSQKVYASEEIWLSRGLKAWGKKRGLDFRIIAEPPVSTSARKVSLRNTPAFFLTLIPFAVCSRRLCFYWYRRPEDGEAR
jgi:glycosyltransferase involved in cell wall biosynthesis